MNCNKLNEEATSSADTNMAYQLVDALEKWPNSNEPNETVSCLISKSPLLNQRFTYKGI